MSDAILRWHETSSADRPISDDQLRSFCTQAQRGNSAARDRILCAHMGLVIHVAKCFYRPGLFCDFGDLVQQGCLGLLRAIDKFDPQRRSRGRRVQFKTYAHYWVTHSIRREIENHGRTITVPVHQLRRVAQVMVPLETTSVTEDDVAPIHAQIADPADSPEQWCRAWEARFLVESLLHNLSARTRAVLRERYGLARRGKPLSQSQVAERLGVTSSRVGQYERAGLHALREQALAFHPV